MTFLAFVNSWNEFVNLSPFLVIGFFVWKLIELIKFNRAKTKLLKRLNEKCNELDSEVLSNYNESEIEKVRICKTLIWHLRDERKSAMTWENRKRMNKTHFFEMLNSHSLKQLEQQMIIDGKKEGTPPCCVESHIKETIGRWKKLDADRSEGSLLPDFAWKVHEKQSWELLTKKDNWVKKK